jgi:hypothetical protein
MGYECQTIFSTSISLPVGDSQLLPPAAKSLIFSDSPVITGCSQPEHHPARVVRDAEYVVILGSQPVPASFSSDALSSGALEMWRDNERFISKDPSIHYRESVRRSQSQALRLMPLAEVIVSDDVLVFGLDWSEDDVSDDRLPRAGRGERTDDAGLSDLKGDWAPESNSGPCWEDIASLGG